MGRLLIAGMIGGGAFMMMSLLRLNLLMIPTGLGVFVAGLVLTHPRHGIPLYLYLITTWRTRLLLEAVRHPQGWTGQAAGLLELHAETLTLDAGQLLAAVAVVEDLGTLDAWEIVPDAQQSSGFEVVTDTLYLEN